MSAVLANPAQAATPAWRVEIVDSEAGLAALAAEWNALSERSDTALLFNSHDWASACWRHFHHPLGAGGDGGRSATLSIRLLRGDDGLLAIAPLWIETRRVVGLALRIARWVGEGPSDYGDLLLARLDPALVDALVAHLAGPQGGCDAIDLRECRGDSPTLPWLRDALRRHARRPGDIDDSVCYAIATAGGWEAYTQRQFSGKRRKDFRREWRNLEAAGGFEWTLLRRLDPLPVWGDAFGAVQAAHVAAGEARPGEFNHPVFRPFLEQVLGAASRREAVRVAVMTRHGQAVAYWLSIAYRGRYYLYNTAHVDEHQRLGAGKLLMLYLLERLFEEGLGPVDYLRGAESYKEVLTEHAVVNRRLTAVCPGVRGRRAALLWGDRLPPEAQAWHQRWACIATEEGVRGLLRRIPRRLMRGLLRGQQRGPGR